MSGCLTPELIEEIFESLMDDDYSHVRQLLSECDEFNLWLIITHTKRLTKEAEMIRNQKLNTKEV